MLQQKIACDDHPEDLSHTAAVIGAVYETGATAVQEISNCSEHL